MNSPNIKKILVFRNDRLGEFLLIIPALRTLKHTFGAKIVAVINPYLKDLAGCVSEIDDIYIWEMKKHRLREIFSFARQIKKEKFDMAVIFNPTKEAHLISFLAAIPVRVGYDRKWGFLLNKKIPDKKDLGLRHEVEYNLELVGLVGAKTEDNSLRIEVPQEKLTEAKQMLQTQDIAENYIVIHPFASFAPKQWPLNNFIELTRLISSKWDVVIIGGRENVSLGKPFQELESHRKIVNLIGKTDLLQLAGVLKGAICLISNDSGPVHLASAVGTKCIVLFDNSVPSRSPKRWKPWGEGHIVIEKPDINQITVEEVYNAFQFLLNN